MKKSTFTSLDKFGEWYLDLCDGDWEHIFRIILENTDNPGWALRVDTNETYLEDVHFKINIERTEHDWIIGEKKEDHVLIGCGPLNLEEMITIFLDWAKENKSKNA
jgi:hypothetical protein